MQVPQEPSGRGHDLNGARTVDQVETVPRAGEFDVTDGGLRYRPQSFDERPRFPDGYQAVVAPVHGQEGWCQGMHALDR